MPCSAGAEHCCHVGRAGVCRYLLENTAGRRWACGLLLELKTWAAVHASAAYRRDVRPHWEAAGLEVECGDFPGPGKTCGACGEVG